MGIKEIFGAIGGGIQKADSWLEEEARKAQAAKLARSQGMTVEQLEELNNLGIEQKRADLEGKQLANDEASMATYQKELDAVNENQLEGGVNSANAERMAEMGMDFDEIFARAEANETQHVLDQEERISDLMTAAQGRESSMRSGNRGDVNAIIGAAEQGIGLEDTPEGLAVADEDAAALVERARRDDTQAQQDRLQRRELIDARIKSLEQSGQLSGMTPSQVNQVMKTLMQADDENIFGRSLDQVSDQELMGAIQRIMEASRESAFR